VIKKRRTPALPSPMDFPVVLSGIGGDVGDFHLLHDLFPLKGM